MTRENKVALVVGFALVLFVGILVSDHLSRAQTQRSADLAPVINTSTIISTMAEMPRLISSGSSNNNNEAPRGIPGRAVSIIGRISLNLTSFRTMGCNCSEASTPNPAMVATAWGAVKRMAKTGAKVIAAPNPENPRMMPERKDIPIAIQISGVHRASTWEKFLFKGGRSNSSRRNEPGAGFNGSGRKFVASQ